MADIEDISKARSFQNWHVIALISITITATAFVTRVLVKMDRDESRIEYVNDRIDKKFKQAIEKIEEE